MSNAVSRQTSLVKLMLDSNDYYPVKYYADLLRVSERTIFNDLTILEGQLKKHNINIVKKPSRGVKLSGNRVSSDKLLQMIDSNNTKDISLTSMERQSLIMKWLILENKTITFHYMSMELFCSTSVIKKDLNFIKYFMDDEVYLISNQKGTRIRGSEEAIQRTLKRYIYYIFKENSIGYSDMYKSKYIEVLFDTEIVDSVKIQMEEINSFLKEDIPEQYLKSFYIYLLIITARSLGGFHPDSLVKAEWTSNEYLSDYPIAIQIANNISNELKFTFTPIEIQNISHQLFAHRIEVNLNNKYIENLLKDDITDLISNISTTMNINLTEDKKLYNSLIYHMFHLIHRLKTNIVIFNPLLEEIKSSYSILFKMIWYAMEDLEGKYNIKLSDNEVTFITIYFQTAIERRTKMRKILVVCQTGIVTSDLITNRIKNLLPENIQFKLIAKPELKDEDTTKVDFIISSVRLEEEPKPVVYVTPLLTEADLVNIYSFYLKHSSNQTNYEIQGNSKEAQRFFDRKYIYINKEINNKENCLEKMIKDFEKNGVVNSNFRNTVYERETLGNTIIHGLIAIPHGNQMDVHISKISIMLTRDSVKWNGKDSVRLIVLLAVKEEDITNVRESLSNFFKNILSVVNLDEFLEGISKPEKLIELFTDNKSEEI